MRSSVIRPQLVDREQQDAADLARSDLPTSAIGCSGGQPTEADQQHLPDPLAQARPDR